MATLKPRLIITLEPETYEVYRKLAKAQGRPMSKLAKEQLDFMAPTLEKVLALSKRIDQTTKKNREAFERGSAKAEEHMYTLFGLFEGIFDAIEESSDTAPSSGPRGVAKARKNGSKRSQNAIPKVAEVDGQKPPSSNTGVTFQDLGSNPGHVATSS